MMKKDKKHIVGDKLRKYSNILIIFVLIVLSLSLAKNISRNIQAQNRIEGEKKKIEELQKENEILKGEIAKVSSDVYIEKQLRNKLGLVKEGEYIVVLPDEETLRKLAPKIRKEEDLLPLPNWKKWINLFFP